MTRDDHAGTATAQMWAAIQDRENRAGAAYDAVPGHIKEDIGEALAWAKDQLSRHEGVGHQINVTSADPGPGVVCSFVVPAWPGDHCGRPMGDAASAIVRAVCEYLELTNP